jgi:hypothetical protein
MPNLFCTGVQDKPGINLTSFTEAVWDSYCRLYTVNPGRLYDGTVAF